MAGIGFFPGLLAAGAGLGQGVQSAQERQQREQQMAIQQMEARNRLLMLQDYLQKQQQGQQAAELSLGGFGDLSQLGSPALGGRPTSASAMIGGGGGAAPAMPAAAGPAMPPAPRSAFEGQFTRPAGIGIPGAPAIFAGQVAPPAADLPWRNEPASPEAYANISGPGAPTGGPSPPPASAANMPPPRPGPNDPPTPITNWLGARAPDGSVPETLQAAPGSRFTQAGPPRSGTMAQAGPDTMTDAGPMPQMPSDQEIMAGVQRDAQARGVNNPIVIRDAFAARRKRAYEEYQKEFQRWQQQRIMGHEAATLGQGRERIDLEKQRIEDARKQRDIAAQEAGKNVQVLDKDGAVIWQGIAHETKGKPGLTDAAGKPVPMPEGSTVKLGDPSKTGRQAAAQIQSMIGSTSELVGEARNLMELPSTAVAGIFQGLQSIPANQLGDAMKRTLASKLTPEEYTDLTTSFQGVSRSLATIEAQGRATGLVGLTGMSQGLMPQNGNTLGNILRKYATIRQIAERNTDAILASPDVSKPQKDFLTKLRAEMASVIPFTVSEVNKWQHGDKTSILDAARRVGLGGGAAQQGQGGVQEGATATNPQTGEKLIYRGGKWEPVASGPPL